MEIINYDNNELTKFYAENELEFDETKGYFGDNIKSYALLEEGKFIGAISTSIYKNKKFIEAIAIDKEQRNKGYGRFLMEKTIEEFGTPVYLISKTHGFFRKIGFNEDETDLIEKECKECEKYNTSCFPKVFMYK